MSYERRTVNDILWKILSSLCEREVKDPRVRYVRRRETRINSNGRIQTHVWQLFPALGVGCVITLHKSRRGGVDSMRTRHGDGRDETRTALISGSSADLSAANSDDANNFRCTELRAIYRCKSKSLRRHRYERKSDLEKIRKY